METELEVAAKVVVVGGSLEVVEKVVEVGGSLEPNTAIAHTSQALVLALVSALDLQNKRGKLFFKCVADEPLHTDNREIVYQYTSLSCWVPRAGNFREEMAAV